MRESTAHLKRDLQAPRKVASAPLLDGVPQALAFQKFHDHERTAVFLPEIINRNDVFVRDAGGEAGFCRNRALASDRSPPNRLEP